MIADAGLGEHFIHRTGHGIGIEEHEDPYLVAGNATPLEVGHAFSVEPGIYLPGRFGMRLEDIVVVGRRRARSPLNTVDHCRWSARREPSGGDGVDLGLERAGGAGDRVVARARPGQRRGAGRRGGPGRGRRPGRGVAARRRAGASRRRRRGRSRSSATWPTRPTPGALVDAAVERFGRLDIVVANAGGPPPGGALDLDDDALRAAVETNLLASVRLVRAALPHMRRPGVGPASAASRRTRSSRPRRSWPCRTRPASGLWAWAKTAAADLAAESGVTLNLVCPGPHATERMRELRGAGAGTMGDPADFGRVVAFLCSRPAAFVNGAAIVVDGGATLAL